MRYQWLYGPATVKNEDSLTDVIIEIAWQCVGFDDAKGNNYKISGSVDTPPVDPAQFTPFDQVTQSQVESWVFAVVDKNQTELALLAQSQQIPDVKPFNF
jgi:hypothetical protein